MKKSFPIGKGYYIWMVRHTLDVMGKTAGELAAWLADHGYTHVLVKINDGTWRYNIDPFGKDRVPEIITACKNYGIEVWGWMYVYGKYPELEARATIRRVQELQGLAGLVVNAEVEYKNHPAEAVIYMDLLRVGVPDSMAIGLSSYRFPKLHQDFPWKAFLDRCDFNMPQVYWLQAHNPVDQLIRCVAEFKSMYPNMVLIPTGAAFREHGWETSPEEAEAFLIEAQKTSQAANFWELRNTKLYIPDVLDAISVFDWDENSPEQPPSELPAHVLGVGTVLTSTLNIRTDPSVSGYDIGDLLRGTVVPIFAIAGSDAWVLISDPKGAECPRWVAVEHLGTRYLDVESKG